MQNNLPLVLDVCCSERAFWFNKNDQRAIYCDRRVEHIEMKPDKSYPNGCKIDVSPDVQSNFTSLPFPTDTFALVVFDPPHIQRKEALGALTKRYGILGSDWRIMLRDGFSECFRVLQPNGTLIFKWAESEIAINDILALTPHQPLFGHKSGKQMKTHWITFTKPNNRMHLTAFGVGTAGEIPLQASLFADDLPATIGGR